MGSRLNRLLSGRKGGKKTGLVKGGRIDGNCNRHAEVGTVNEDRYRR